MAFLEWLEYSALAEWVATSTWGYPVLLTTHSIGLGIIVGILFVINLRMLGAFSKISVVTLAKLFPLTRIAFALNLSSGFALFMNQATLFATHPAFVIKITAVIIALMNARVIEKRIQTEGEQWDLQKPIPNNIRMLAAGSIALWLIAIITGRLIAYVE